MSDLINAANEVRKMLKGFKAVEEVSAALEKVGSIENAGKEAEAKLESLKALIASASSDLDSGIAMVNEAKDQAKKIASDAKAKAEARISKANEDAAEIVAAATAAANAINEEASRAASTVSELVSEKKALAFDLAEIEAKVSKAKAYLTKLAG
jgi:hypothetical protein